MAVSLTDHRTIWSEADAITNFTGSPQLFTSDPDPIESTGCIGYQVSTATVDAFSTGTSTDMSSHLIYVWVLPRGAMDSKANGGVSVHLGDGTDRIAFHVAGKDVSAFRHDEGPVAWMCLLLDTNNLPAQYTVRAGSLANLTKTAITQLGATFKTLAKSVGGAANCFIDIIRYGDPSANNGCMATVAGGTSGAPGTFYDLAVLDRSTGNQQGYGMVRELGPSMYGVQAPLRFGDQGTGSSWFEAHGVSVVFESRGIGTSRYKFYLTDNGTGTTTFKSGTKVGTGSAATGSNGGTFIAPTGVGAEWDSATDTDVTDVFMYGCTFSGFSNGVKFRAPQEWAGNSFSTCGQIQPNAAYMVNCSIVGSTATAALLWNTNDDTSGKLDGASFVSSGTGHAIEIGTTAPSTLTFTGVTFSGYASSNGSTGNEAVYVNRSSGTITIYADASFSYRTAGATVNVIAGAKTATLTVTDVAGSPISGASVAVYAKDATGDLPYKESVTISNSGTTATVTHTAHGMLTNDKALIENASLWQNNGVFSITVTDANTYTYTLPSAPGSSPTGTITSTYAAIFGTTDANGQASVTRVFSANQPIVGWARKSTSAPYYQTGTVTGGPISSTANTALSALLLKDE